MIVLSDLHLGKVQDTVTIAALTATSFVEVNPSFIYTLSTPAGFFVYPIAGGLIVGIAIADSTATRGDKLFIEWRR